MSPQGVTLHALIERHRTLGSDIPIDVCLMVATHMARASTRSAAIGFDGVVEATAEETSLHGFGEALFELLTLKSFDGDADVGDRRDDAPPQLVELLFELLSGAPAGSWQEVADRLESLRDDADCGPRDLARYMRRTFPAPVPVRDAHALLGGAFDEEIARFDLRIARVWQLMTAAALVIAAVTALTVSRRLGLWSAAYLLALLAWFTFHAFMLRTGRGGRRLAVVTIAVTTVLPWPYLVLAYFTEGAAYALSSWVVPLVVTFIIGASVVRLQPVEPIITGAVAGVMMPLIYFTLLRHGLSAEEALNAAYRPSMQFTRGASLAVVGVLAAVITRTLRDAIAKAERTQRQRDLFGKYRLLEPIASGGMGAVYEALYCPEGGFERRVALKRMHAHLASEAKFVDAFRREAEMAARLVHPNIVQVLDFGQVEGSYFLAMEYVDGATLRDVMSFQPRLAPQLVAHIGHEILAALTHAHGARLRIIHRDLSPANVLLSQGGEVKLTDFGVAKALRDATNTVTSTVAGHYGYMAPEQTTSDPLDERCDLFAVGVLIWEMLVGRRLFGREEPAATLLAVVNDEIPQPSALRADLDPSWDVLLGKALRRDRKERFASAEDMLAALEPILRAAGGPCSGPLGALVAATVDKP